MGWVSHLDCNMLAAMRRAQKDVFWRWKKFTGQHFHRKSQGLTELFSLTYKPSLQEIRSSLRTTPNYAGTTGTNTFIDQIQGVCSLCSSENCGILCRKLPRAWLWRMYDYPWSESLLGRIESPFGRKRQTRDPTRLWWTTHPIAVLNHVLLSGWVLKFNTTSNSFSRIQRQKWEWKMDQQIDK